MKEDPFERKLAILWLVCAGGFAVALVLFLMRTDLELTYSDGSLKNDELLSEVRLAQTSLGSANVDIRSDFINPKESSDSDSNAVAEHISEGSDSHH